MPITSNEAEGGESMLSSKWQELKSCYSFQCYLSMLSQVGNMRRTRDDVISFSFIAPVCVNRDIQNIFRGVGLRRIG